MTNSLCHNFDASRVSRIRISRVTKCKEKVILSRFIKNAFLNKNKYIITIFFLCEKIGFIIMKKNTQRCRGAIFKEVGNL